MKTRVRAIIVENDQLCLIHRVKDGVEYWVFPGGGVEKYDADFEQAMRRECQEELGYDGQVGPEFARADFPTPTEPQIEIFYLCSLGVKTGPPMTGSEFTLDPRLVGTSEIVWIPLSKALTLNVKPTVIRDQLVPSNISFLPHHRRDIPHRVAWLNNPVVKQFVDGEPNHRTTLAEQSAWFSRYEADTAKKFFTIYAGPTPIGLVGLSQIDLKNRSAQLFVMIGVDACRGKGIGQFSTRFITDYALQTLQLDRVYLEVYPDNRAAINCYEKAGYVRSAATIPHSSLILMEYLRSPAVKK